jgi:hypothetical protein
VEERESPLGGQELREEGKSCHLRRREDGE